MIDDVSLLMPAEAARACVSLRRSAFSVVMMIYGSGCARDNSQTHSFADNWEAPGLVEYLYPCWLVREATN